MTVTELAEHAETGHAEHAHGEFIAHHFDTPEQQYDSGKLGIWLFLVTEILFFSGLFCAYTLYRAHHPEIFVQASTFLDKVLGGINTIVLLFSSLTMALAVRSSQLVERRRVITYLVITMVCAAIFLGIKAVEYSHKWDEGIFVRAYFNLHEHQAQGLSTYLVIFSVPFLVMLAISVIGALGCRATGKRDLALFFAGLAIMFGGYFAGAVGGKLYMNWKSARDAQVASHDSHGASPAAGYATDQPLSGNHPAGKESAPGHEAANPLPADHASPAVSQTANHADSSVAGDEAAVSHAPASLDRDIGIFFSIYYCMTGLHAFHVLGGMAALSWLLYRSIKGHWRTDYFGPVDFVGLYWHLVDLIWIFLFPLLYLIN
jgi:cytochrome c oxidase subunit 3